MVDGLPVAGPFNGNGVSQFGYDVANAQELQVLVSGGLGEAEAGGPSVNIVPRSGGNTFRGSAFFGGTGDKFVGDNIDDALRAVGIEEPAVIRHNYDVNGSYGGPVRRDRLWFFASGRQFAHADVVEGGRAPNLNAGDPTRWDYVPETGVEVRDGEYRNDASVRLTGQLTPRNRVAYSYQWQKRCAGSTITLDGDGCRRRTADWIAMGSTTTSPEAIQGYMDDPNTLMQVTWTSTLSNRMLIDAAASRFRYGIVGAGFAAPDSVMNLTGVQEQSAIPYGRALTYRGMLTYGREKDVPWNWRGSVAYVTGSHNAKAGYMGSYQIRNQFTFANDTLMRYRFNNGVANAVTYQLTSEIQQANRTQVHAFYVQDQWTRGRMSLQGAIRYDYASSFAPAEGNGSTTLSAFLRQPLTFERTEGVTGFHDISPRVGVAYDLFGTGKTALKVNAGRYLRTADASGIYVANNPAGRVQTSVANRGWTDTNGNRVVDCDLLNPAAQTVPGGDTCAGVTGNSQNFGNLNPTTTVVDPDVLGGWDTREFNWQFGASVQHELVPRVSLEVGYNRRWWGNRAITINERLNQGLADYDTFTVTVPSHTNLPGAGNRYTYITIKPEANARGTQNFQTLEKSLIGENPTWYWHGFDVTLNARLRNGLTVQGGTSTGRGVRNTCALWEKYPSLRGSSNRAEACDVREDWISTFRSLASYTVPKVDVLVSMTFRSTLTSAGGGTASSGGSLSADYQIPNTVIRDQLGLGRLPTGGTATGNTTVNLLLPGELYPLDRQNRLDMRFAKILRFGGRRLDIGVDLYNLPNLNTTTGYEETYEYATNGANWLTPQDIIAPRVVRFNFTMSF
jgi:hypothetical protein